MAFNFTNLKEKTAQIEEWFSKELSSIRTGRAAPAILDSVSVDAYGSKMGIRELANVSVEGEKTIRIAPWDASLSKAIEKAIIASNLGLSVAVDDKGIRIIFPDLTGERREQLIKLLKQKLEEARASVRQVREKTWEEIQTQEKEGGMSEDEKFRYKDEMQKYIDETNNKLEEIVARKEKEIRG